MCDYLLAVIFFRSIIVTLLFMIHKFSLSILGTLLNKENRKDIFFISSALIVKDKNPVYVLLNNTGVLSKPGGG